MHRPHIPGRSLQYHFEFRKKYFALSRLHYSSLARSKLKRLLWEYFSFWIAQYLLFRIYNNFYNVYIFLILEKHKKFNFTYIGNMEMNVIIYKYENVRLMNQFTYYFQDGILWGEVEVRKCRWIKKNFSYYALYFARVIKKA